MTGKSFLWIFLLLPLLANGQKDTTYQTLTAGSGITITNFQPIEEEKPSRLHTITVLGSGIFAWEDKTPSGYDFTPGIYTGVMDIIKNEDLLLLKEGGYSSTWNPNDSVTTKILSLGVSTGGQIVDNFFITGGFRVWKELQMDQMGVGVTFKLIFNSQVGERVFITTVADLWVRPFWGGSLGLGVSYRLNKKKATGSP